MKKINSFILFGAAVFAFAACSNETQIENSPKPQEPVYETLSVKIGNEATTRVSLVTDAATAAFETGDKIAVWTDVNAFQVCAVDGSGNITVDVTRPRSNYAVYYTGATAPTFNGTDLTITLPTTYDYADVAGDKNPVPMVAKNVGGDAADMTFYAVCGLARITLTGIPATATKLLATFSHDVTGDFLVYTPGTTSPYILAESKSTKNEITINLTPLTDYTGAVINLPVPVGDDISIHIDAYNGSDILQFKNFVIQDWDAVRAHGKKATCAFIPSMASMILAPGNLYTDGTGALHMAANCYEHIYAFSNNGDYANAATYSALNRTHFNFNETYLLMKTGALGDNHDAYTNADSYDSPALIRDDIDGAPAGDWRVPSQADWCSITTGEAPGVARPGATLNATITSTSSSSSTSGWKAIKAVVSGMGTAGTSSEDGTTALAADATGPSTAYQAGLLIFPDNVVIDGTFVTLGDKDEITGHNNATTLTKANLDELITAGCAFLPEVGRHNSGSFGFVGQLGTYWSSTQYDTDEGYYLHFQENSFQNDIHFSKQAFRSVRLVKK